MQWYKHQTTDRDELNSKLIRSKFGAKGYGIHVSLLEVIAQNVRVDNIPQWGSVDPKHDIESLAIECSCTKEELQAFFAFVDEKGIYKKRDNVLYYPEMLNRLDEYAQRVQRSAMLKRATQQSDEPVGSSPVNIGNKKKNKKKKENKNIEEEGEYEKTDPMRLIGKWNEVFGTKYKNAGSIEKNLSYWKKTYTMLEILKTVEIAKTHHFWKDKITPEILLRRKSPNGEDVDRIGEMLVYVPKKSFESEDKNKFNGL